MINLKTPLRLLVLLCLFSNHTFGQHSTDQQWLVVDGFGKEGTESLTNNFVNLINSNKFKVSGVTYPAEDMLNPPHPFERNYSNNFFAIFQNGTYHLARGEGYSVEDPLDVNIEDGNEYQFGNISPIKYLYLTNTYEEEDPPERVVVDNDPTALEPMDETSQPNTIRLNHNPVANKDLTIIIDGELGGTRLVNKSCTLSYDIYNEIGDLEMLDFELESSPFSNNSNILHGTSVNGTSNFTSNETIISTGPDNTFLNYKVGFSDDALVGNEIVFELDCGEGFVYTTKQREEKNIIAGNYHDPNYVELKCVWQKGIRKFAKYIISCYNESETAGVGNVKFEFILPDKALANTINIGYDFNGTNFARCSRDSNLEIDGQKITYDFQFPLGEYFENIPGPTINDYSAGMTFCVELRPDTDILHDDLAITNPISWFQTSPYPITTFIDNKSCKWQRTDTEKKYQKQERMVKLQSERAHWDCRRTPKKCLCDCLIEVELPSNPNGGIR